MRRAPDVGDSETQRQIEELRTREQSQQRVRDAHQRRLYVLQEQAAQFGKRAPAELVIEIADTGTAIQALDEELREIKRLHARLALAPTSALQLPDGPSGIPQLVPAIVDTRLQALEVGQARLEGTLGSVLDLVEITREESREYRQSERLSRIEGQRTHRLIYGLVALAFIAVAVALFFLR